MNEPPPSPEQWTRLQAIRESGEFCCILLESQADDVWDIVVRREAEHHVRVPLSGGSCLTLGGAIDAAHANWQAERLGDK